MISYRAKCLFAAASALALIATVSVARTVQNYPPSADQPHVSIGSAVGAAPARCNLCRTCGTASSFAVWPSIPTVRS